MATCFTGEAIRGRRAPLPHKQFARELAKGDSAEMLLARLASMACHPAVLRKAAHLIGAIHHSVETDPRPVALGNGTRSYHLAMRIRNLHDALGLHVHDLCHGALYRSRRSLDLLHGGGGTKEAFHCEHTIQASILAALIYDHLRGHSLRRKAHFILSRGVVTALTRMERKALDEKRYCGTNRKGSWVRSHPDFPEGRPREDGPVRPFRRYLDTDIEIIFVPTGEQIDCANSTWSDHVIRLRRFRLYRAATYMNVAKAVVK